MKKILITGATGMVGKKLYSALKERGYIAHCVVRKKQNIFEHEFVWDYENHYLEEGALEGIHSIIHLTGATIAKRWTTAYKKEIISSRMDSALFIEKKIKEKNIKLQSFISASGINYYGDWNDEKAATENDEPQKKDFLTEVCRLWEDSANRFEAISERIVKLRISPVIYAHGGFLEPLKKLTNLHLASPVGSGKQYFPWIHVDDLVGMLVFALENENMNGPFNACADEVPTNAQLMKTLAKSMDKNYIPIAVPSVVLKLTMGEMSEMILNGVNASNQKIKSKSFIFKYNALDDALKNVVK